MNLEADSVKMGIPLCFLWPLVVLAWTIVLAVAYGIIATAVVAFVKWVRGGCK